MNTLSDSKLENIFLTKILSVGNRLFEIDQEKNALMFDNDYKYVFTSEFKNNNILFLRIVGLFQFGSSNKIIGFDDDIDIPTIKMLIRYIEKDSSYSFSLYTDSDILGKLNLGQIMLKYGFGGGHPKACGGTITIKDAYELSAQIDEFYSNKNYKASRFHYQNTKLSSIFDISGNENIEEFKKISDNIMNCEGGSKFNNERFELDIDFLVRTIFCVIAREVITKKNN